tara:strand:- start:64 stop:447 length:384 start_codon:yes stop_codon:yes gene_type:complete
MMMDWVCYDRNVPATLTPLRSVAELDEALAQSAENPLLLFKHSVECGTSLMALDELKRHLEDASDAVLYRLITVQTEREVSDTTVTRLGVPHRSPQVILVRAGEAVWNASHLQITAEALRAAELGHI